MIDQERHRELLRKGYTVRAEDGGHVLCQNGVRVSDAPRRSREEAWDDAGEDSYQRAMAGKGPRGA